MYSKVVWRSSRIHRVALLWPTNIAFGGEFLVVVFYLLQNVLPTQVGSVHLDNLVLIIHMSDLADFLLCFFEHVAHWCGVFTVVETSCLGEKPA